MKVAVLLALYNGMKWINEQVNSILNQEKVHVHIFISIDPSNDGSQEWAQKLACTNKQVTLLETNEKYGSAAPNFFRLIKDVDFSDYDFIAYADQDDIWNKNKLYRAIQIIKNNNYDAYSSNVIAFWPDGDKKLIKKSQAQVKWDFLFESAGPGCTFVLTKTLALDLKKFIIKNSKEMKLVWLHDWFTYAFARSNNYKWYIDEKPSLLYRQHLGNQVGANKGLSAIIYRAKFILTGKAMKQSSLLASLLDLENNSFVKKWHNHSRLGFLKLARHAKQCRRKPTDRLFFIMSCLVLFLLGN